MGGGAGMGRSMRGGARVGDIAWFNIVNFILYRYS